MLHPGPSGPVHVHMRPGPSGTLYANLKEPKKTQKQKKQPKPFFIFIILAYLLNIGSRGRHKNLCLPKKLHMHQWACQVQ